jgi:hypothetical protein
MDSCHSISVPRSPRWPLICAGLLLAANLVVPLVWGDVYPFTSAPMFRDCPARCCNYQVLAADGAELPAEDWLAQRVYDGNPVGYGVGICPPSVLEQEFGLVASEDAVRRHFEQQLARPEHRPHAYLDVVQQVLGPLENSQRVGIVETNRWRISRQ